MQKVKKIVLLRLLADFIQYHNLDQVKFPEDKFKESKLVVLNSSEDLFAELRDQNFSAVGGILRLKTNEIQEIYRQKDKAQSMHEMKKLVQQLPALNTLKQSLTIRKFQFLCVNFKNIRLKNTLIDCSQIHQSLNC